MAEQLGRNEEVEEMLRLGENIENTVQGAVPPQGEQMAYSPTSSEGSLGHSLHDDDSMAGAVENDEEIEDDLQDIVMLYQVEERVRGRGG